MSALETRTVALTAKQWRHVEIVITDLASKAWAEADELHKDEHTAAAVQCSLDAEFNADILLALRSAGA